MKGCKSVRNVLWWLVFLGFAVNYMMRINLNIAIVSMVQMQQFNLSNITYVNESFPENFQMLSDITKKNEEILPQNDKLRWDEYQQNLILGAFFWLHWLSQIPGGILARHYGTKLVFGLSNLSMCLIAFFIPICAELDYRALIALRILQGLIGGLSWPSMHNLTASWIPPNERSRFVTAYVGGSLGIAITYPLCGILIDSLQWTSVFYITGALGILWFGFWWLLVYDTPEKHPRISVSERILIINSLGQSVMKTKIPIPWKKILMSYPMWINIFAQWGNIWSIYTLMTQAPTYFKYIHGWNIRMTGVWSGLPHLCRIAFTYILATLTDYLLCKEMTTVTNVRKMITSLGCIGQALFLLGLAFSGSNYVTAILCMTAATAMSGVASTGSLASFIDLSPNFASIMLGVCNMICSAPGFISPIVVGTLTYHNQTMEQWQLVFLISAAMLLAVGLLYLFCSSSELQDWNSPTKTHIQLEEAQLMSRPSTEAAVERRIVIKNVSQN